MNLQKCQTNELLSVAFNQDYGCFAVGTDQGFRIYNCEPFKETFRRDFASGGIGMVEMLFRCNILALVGGGRNPRYPPHKVMIWDDHQNRCIGELSFRSEVRAVRLRRDRVVVALSSKVYVYNFADLSLLDHIETADNSKGLCALCPAPSNNVLAVPGMQKGDVRIELYDLRKTTLIAAHEAALACLALNATGTRLATASEKGTLIRVYDTLTGELLQELRRGTDKADIVSIAFNANASMLASTSDKGTVHIFKLNERVHDNSAAASGTPTGAAGSSASSSAAAGGSSAGASASPAGYASSRSLGGAGVAAPGGGGGSTPGGGDGDGVMISGSAGGERPHNPSFGFMKGILPKYFSSEWSFSQFRVPDARSIVAFGNEPNTIIIVGADGSFFKAAYDPEKPGEATRVAYAQFVKGGDL